MTAISPRYLLKRIIKNVICIITTCSGYQRVCRNKTNKKGLTILTYHSISNEIEPDETVTPEEFEKQLQYIKENYKVISLEEAVEYIQTDIEKISGSIVITFDDGYSDNYRYAYPLLNKHNFPATIFLVSDFINDKEGKYLSQSQINEMKSNNISFGSHTVSHRILTGLRNEEIIREIRGSKDILESRLGQRINSFAYPVGTMVDFNDGIIKTVRASKYVYACSNVYGINGNNTDIFALKRIGVETTDNFFIFKKKIGRSIEHLVI
ncbi:MAG: putative polysaccharide deacetylase [Candidatus Scalindua brodae]|uniref:Putative polysaccharide deacetylase n=1 Tax=Candidatus Scalindua brodae TaxID=237368 RepID=A0A0B0ERR2_9BACT|nr:MAG: putative polysaccharide deacetylase [Candidatus Scalindua brodae]